MAYNRDLRHRRSIRLPCWEYAESGAYFVTICTRDRECLFDNASFLAIVEEVWGTVVGSGRGPGEFVAMPNHVHGIIWIGQPDAVGAQQPQRLPSVPHLGSEPRPISDHTVAAPLRRFAVAPASLVAIVRAFKSAVAKRINNSRKTLGAPVWQRNYYERVIRDEDDLNRIRQYILDNPQKWAEDPENPAAFMNPRGANDGPSNSKT